MSLSRRKFIQKSAAASALLALGQEAARPPAEADGRLISPLFGVSSVPKPHVVGDWRTIAGDPDLGDLTSPNQQPVDFAIWQAKDGAWQVVSCIRSTKEVGHTRLLYRWQGVHLTDAHWTPQGIFMRADPQFGEDPGGLQAPYVFRDGKRFVMMYGSWSNICSAESADGKSFQRILNADGKSTLFSEGAGNNTRDPDVIRIGNTWYCYYTAYPDNHGRDFCRTSRNLRDWSASRVVADGGEAGTGPYSSECPFVVEPTRGNFYLFRTQQYGENAQTSVYYSRDPLDFGRNDDKDHFVCTLPICAPEIVHFQGEWFIAALLPDLKGIQVSHLTWE